MPRRQLPVVRLTPEYNDDITNGTENKAASRRTNIVEYRHTSELTLRPSHHLTILPLLGTEFSISFQLKINKVQGCIQQASIMTLKTAMIPEPLFQIFMVPDENDCPELHVKKHQYTLNRKREMVNTHRIGLMPVEKWIRIEIRQHPDTRGVVVFEVLLGDEKSRTVNLFPVAFPDVEVHITEDLTPLRATMRNLRMRLMKERNSPGNANIGNQNVVWNGLSYRCGVPASAYQTRIDMIRSNNARNTHERMLDGLDDVSAVLGRLRLNDELFANWEAGAATKLKKFLYTSKGQRRSRKDI
jgi:hypothetical protein